MEEGRGGWEEEGGLVSVVEAREDMDGRDWLYYFFGGVGCVLGELRGDWWSMSVRRTSDRLQRYVWDNKIDNTEIEGRKSEKV